MEKISKRELSRIAALTKKNERREQGKILIEGWRLVRDAAAAGALEKLLVVRDAAMSGDSPEILADAQKRGVPVLEIEPKDLKRLTSAVTPPGVIGIANFRMSDAEAALDAARGRPVVYLYEVADPGNLGTIIRTAHALGGGAVIISPGSCDPTNAKAARGSMGAIFRIRLASGDAAAVFDAARKRGYVIAATAPPGETADAGRKSGEPPESLRGRTALVIFGSEPRGLPENLLAAADEKITIPIETGAESLNVAASCAIILHALRVRV